MSVSTRAASVAALWTVSSRVAADAGAALVELEQGASGFAPQGVEVAWHSLPPPALPKAAVAAGVPWPTAFYFARLVAQASSCDLATAPTLRPWDARMPELARQWTDLAVGSVLAGSGSRPAVASAWRGADAPSASVALLPERLMFSEVHPAAVSVVSGVFPAGVLEISVFSAKSDCTAIEARDFHDLAAGSTLLL